MKLSCNLNRLINWKDELINWKPTLIECIMIVRLLSVIWIAWGQFQI